MKKPARIVCKRVYDDADDQDGHRVLIDHMWPRGIRKEDLNADEWRKDLAPSNDLRKWFGHDPKLWAAFYQKYHAELDRHSEEITALLNAAEGGPLTLLYAARDRDHNNAVALKMYLEKRG